MSGFDLKNEEKPVEVPKHLKGLAQGRMVRYAPQDGQTRAAVVVNVVDKAAGLAELHIFWTQGDPAGAVPVDDQTGAAGVVRYHPEGKAGTWHWPAFEG